MLFLADRGKLYFHILYSGVDRMKPYRQRAKPKHLRNCNIWGVQLWAPKMKSQPSTHQALVHVLVVPARHLQSPLLWHRKLLRQDGRRSQYSWPTVSAFRTFKDLAASDQAVVFSGN